jgi:isoquinoline 1-oxidoreductase alpha subunit
MTRMTVNGEAVQYRLDPSTPLLWALRDASNLTGTKYGCDSRDCGACTVIIDGSGMTSCSVTIGELDGAQVTTIEGLSGDRSHPVQKAWLAEQVTMCGYRRASEHLPLRRLSAHQKGDRARGEYRSTAAFTKLNVRQRNGSAAAHPENDTTHVIF